MLVEVINPRLHSVRTNQTRDMTNEEFDENLEILLGTTKGTMSVEKRRRDGTFGGIIGDKIFVGIRIKRDRQEYMELKSGNRPRLTGATFDWDASREMFIASRKFNYGETYSLSNILVDFLDPDETEELKRETVIENVVPFTTQEQEDRNMLRGERKVTREGVDGYDTVIYDVIYANGVEIDRKQVSRITTRQVSKIIKVGTKVVVETKREAVVEVIPKPEPEYVENPNKKAGEELTLKRGYEGKTTIIYEITYENGEEVKREELSRTTVDATGDIIEIGTYDGPVETIIVEPEAPTQIDNVVYIPYDSRLIYKNVITGEILYEDIEFNGGLVIEAMPSPDTPASIKYELTGIYRWEFESRLEATGREPVRRGNTIAIPKVDGMNFYNASTEEKLTGTFDFTGRIIITSDGEFAQTWIFEPQTPVMIEPPIEHEGHVVIPEVEGAVYRDDFSGTILEPGERLIGDKLTVRAILTEPDVSYNFSGGPTSWSYIRPGGITALPVGGAGTERATIPTHSLLEYYNPDNGEVFVPGERIYATDYEDSEFRVRVRIKDGTSTFLNNPYAEWHFSYTPPGFETGQTVVWELRDWGGGFGLGYDGWRSIMKSNEIFNFVEIYLNGEQITSWRGTEIPHGEAEVIIKLKERSPNGYRLEWTRNKEAIPIKQKLFFSDLGNGKPGPNHGYMTLEDIGSNTLKWQGTIIDSIYKITTWFEIWEVEDEKPSPGAKITTQQWALFNIRNPITNNLSGHSVPILNKDIGKYMRIFVDDVELKSEDFKIELDPDADFTYQQAQSFILEEGTRKITLSLKGSEHGGDFRWLRWDEGIKSCHIFIGGKRHNFETDDNGDMVWEGVVPRGAKTGFMQTAIFTSEPAELDNEPPRVEAPYFNTNNRSILIPDVQDYMLDYVDYDFPEIVYEPGIHFLTRDTRIYARMSSRIRKVGGRYMLLRIYDNRIRWTFRWFQDNEFKITARKPVQSGYVVHIPEDPSVYYWDTIAREIVTGSIDLRKRRNGLMVIQPFPGWWNYELTNKGITWTFTESEYVRAEKPTQRENTIVIPSNFGVEYFNTITGAILKGEVRIIRDITIGIRPIEDFILDGDVHEWTFSPVEGTIRNVKATPPVIEGNWITIPSVSGVEYYDVATGKTLSDIIYVSEELNIRARPAQQGVNVTNEQETWTYTYTPPVEKDEKPIIIKGMPEGATIEVNGKPIGGRSIAVLLNEEVTISIVLPGNMTFNGTPQLIDTTKAHLFGVNNNIATLRMTFTSVKQAEIRVGGTTGTYQSFMLLGSNITAEVVNKTSGEVLTTTPGQPINLVRKNDYRFVIRAQKGYIFDRDGIVTYGDTTTALKPLNDTTASTQLISVSANVAITIDAYKVEEETPTDTIGFNNLYLVDKSTLSEISRDFLVRKRQFMVSPGGAGGLQYDSQLMTDPHTYIINTIQLPFEIEDADIANRSRVRLGFTELRPSAPRLNKDKLTLDLGTIRVEPKYNNAYDYKNTSIMLHLPYTNTVMVEPNYAVGETISIEYLVDAYTGHTTINLRSSLVNGNVFHTVETYIGNEIPFISMKDGSTVGSTGETRSLINNNTPRPYVEVIRNIPHQMDSIFNRDVTESVDQLGSVRGRVYVHNISLDLDATTAEVSTIKSILSGGITIK